MSEVWFEWQNRAVEREMAKWIEYNSEEFSSGFPIQLENNGDIKKVCLLGRLHD